MQTININYLTRLIQPYGSYIAQAFDKLDSTRISSIKRIKYLEKVNDAITEKLTEQLNENLSSNIIISPQNIKDLTAQPTWIIYGIIEPNHFIYHNPHFAFAIGYYDQATLQHCCCYDVIRDEMFSASLGKGVQINKKKCRQPELIAIDSPDINTTIDPSIDIASLNLSKHNIVTQKPLTLLDFAYLASNRINLIIKTELETSLEDAASLFFRESGGCAYDEDSQPIWLPKHLKTTATNPS